MSKSSSLLANYKDKSILSRKQRVMRQQDEDNQKYIRFALQARTAGESAVKGDEHGS